MMTTTRRGTTARATSADVQAKIDLLIEAAVARGRVRSPETLRDLDKAAIDFHRVARAETMEREHAIGVCGPSCVFCERARERESEEETV